MHFLEDYDCGFPITVSQLPLGPATNLIILLITSAGPGGTPRVISRFTLTLFQNNFPAGNNLILLN